MSATCLCGAPLSLATPAFRRGETDFVDCPSCGLLLRQRFPSEAELEAIYAEAFASSKVREGETDQESPAHAVATLADALVSRFVSGARRCLDFGAGTGALVLALRARGVEADGVEWAEQARAFARAERGLALEQDLSSSPPDRYDLVTMIEVIEHLLDPASALAQVRRVLRPGGRLVVTTPNRRGLRARLDGGEWREAKKKFHLLFFDERSLHHHLRAAGFVHVRSWRSFPPQHPGVRAWLKTRALQAARLQGTLFVVAEKGPRA